MRKRNGVVFIVVLLLICFSFITVFIVQAQSDDDPEPEPDQPTAVPDESSAIDWSQIVLPVHEDILAPPASSSSPATYTIQPGDTLFHIAQRFGLTTQALATANNIANTNLIYVGKVLTIPSGNPAPQPEVSPTPVPAPPPSTGGTYTVQAGDTLSQIARKFGVEMQTLAAVNSIPNPSFIRVGQVLTIPGAATAAPIPANPQPAPIPATPPPTDGQAYVVQQGDTLYIIARKFGVTVRSLAAANQIKNHNLIYPGQTLIISATNPAPAAPDPDAIFIWPVSSRSIVKGYFPGHGAIDIVVASGTAVQAMAAGKVEYAGWNNYGYGNLVVVDHGNGWRTLYAHNSEFAVKTGDAVGQGDVIAYSGNTGYSSMPHIHLEMMLNFGAVNPCLHLPGGC